MVDVPGILEYGEIVIGSKRRPGKWPAGHTRPASVWTKARAFAARAIDSDRKYQKAQVPLRISSSLYTSASPNVGSCPLTTV